LHGDFVSLERSTQSKHTFKQQKIVDIPRTDIDTELILLFSRSWLPRFNARKKLEVHNRTDEMSPITENPLVVTGATFFFLECFHFDRKVLTDRNNPHKESNTKFPKPI